VYKILIGKHEGKKPLAGTQALMTGHQDGSWRNRMWRALQNTVMNLGHYQEFQPKQTQAYKLLESLTAEREQVRTFHNMCFRHLGILLLQNTVWVFGLVPFLQLAIHLGSLWAL
jgi:hypothetical protein